MPTGSRLGGRIMHESCAPRKNRRPGISGTLSGRITMSPRAMTTRPLPRLRHGPPAPPCRQPGVPVAAAAVPSRLRAVLLPAALLLAALLPLAACGRRVPPNLLLITLDTTRAD